MSPVERRNSYTQGELHVPVDQTYRKVSRDVITGLLNPHALLAILDYTIEREQRAEAECTLVFIHLPEPTRTLVGDERLFQLVARFLRRTLRGEDAIGRIGNGFLVLLSDTGATGAQVVVDRLSEGLWQNLGLAIAGRWDVHFEVSLPEDDGRTLIERATAAVPGLAEESLPRERGSILPWTRPSRR